MAFSQVLPKKVGLKMTVLLFGRSLGGNPEIVIQTEWQGVSGEKNVIVSLEHKYQKLHGDWHDSHGSKLDDEDSKMIEECWLGECKRVGLDPETPFKVKDEKN